MNYIEAYLGILLRKEALLRCRKCYTMIFPVHMTITLLFPFALCLPSGPWPTIPAPMIAQSKRSESAAVIAASAGSGSVNSLKRSNSWTERK